MAGTIDDKEYRALLESVRLAYGYDFTNYAEPSVKRRILHFMACRRMGSVENLREILIGDPAVFEEFVQEISVTVTEMFRDPSFYKSLREKVIPRLATYPVIKIWLAGCATGEEAYSIAILLREERLLDRSIIYSTDINQKSLETARTGVYPLEKMKEYTRNYLAAGGKSSFSEYYAAKFDSALIDQSLAQHILFAPHNLATDNSFNEFQMIVCRNVLMYFNQGLQNRVLSLFLESLCSFGFLGLGDKETLLFSSARDNFDELSRVDKIYMKHSMHD